ncbi:MAG: fatty acid--CoA ligase [Candidatus Competibacteraceae bacterium]|nr:fatty acid--CoA ligase [Candidatus Competibacteraceae bacterium]MBK7983157.1 fatty acid--CoA ligase [Candidatus Competibacteraceae bacterium]MBK8898296.1 fatty acid--CoA ligase [Candidatus Competibacteraceae bacterium]MBK8962102.1 fatty acid--CoA ligase [Candidatus Competibacteraceae bacterium]MBK9951315.1 fatty acid--CoA ligase [Candidatus Competibacteraceae bacterium]
MSANVIDPTPFAYSYPLLIKNLLRNPVRQFPDQEIVYSNFQRQRYRDLGERVGRLASGLARLGVKPGATVAVMDWDSHRYLECFFAVPMMGAVLHTVNIRLSPEQILYTINHAEDDVILVNTEFLPILEAIRDRIEPVKKLVLLNDTEQIPATALDLSTDYETLLASGDPAYPFPDFSEDTRATTFYTTGTTGLPKGVYFSHRQLVLHTFGILAALMGNGQGRFNRDDVYLPLTPMFHVHAWGVPYVATTLGVKQVYPGRYVPEHLLRLIEREKATFSHCVPTILQLLLASPVVDDVDLSRWKVIIGGAALPQALARQARARGVDVFTAYGMSETCPILTLAQLKPHMADWDEERQLDIRCKTGLPIPLVELRIVDEQMNDLPHDGKTPGEVVVRSPWLTQGYLKDPQNSEQLWRGGYLHTGDIGVIDQEGYLKITDRLKDVIKTGGEWLSSLELEDLILKHPAAAETAVIGIPDATWGERPLALVVLKRAGAEACDETAFRDWLKGFADKGVIPKWAVPDRVLFVEALPKTSVGKLDKKALRGQYQQTAQLDRAVGESNSAQED